MEATVLQWLSESSIVQPPIQVLQGKGKKEETLQALHLLSYTQVKRAIVKIISPMIPVPFADAPSAVSALVLPQMPSLPLPLTDVLNISTAFV